MTEKFNLTDLRSEADLALKFAESASVNSLVLLALIDAVEAAQRALDSNFVYPDYPDRLAAALARFDFTP